jgi:hypothetical protein
VGLLPVIYFQHNMPAIKGIPGPYRFFFYSFDCNEPIYVHVKRENMLCKFWLGPTTLSQNHGYAPSELNRIRTLIDSYHDKIVEAWHEHCG